MVGLVKNYHVSFFMDVIKTVGEAGVIMEESQIRKTVDTEFAALLETVKNMSVLILPPIFDRCWRMNV